MVLVMEHPVGSLYSFLFMDRVTDAAHAVIDHVSCMSHMIWFLLWDISCVMWDLHSSSLWSDDRDAAHAVRHSYGYNYMNILQSTSCML